MKSFLTKLSLMVLPIVCTIIYYATMVEPVRNGDLGQLGLLPFADEYHQYIKSMRSDSLYEIDIDNLDFEPAQCDSAILIIGDSFSEQNKGGFTNFLAMLYPGYKVYIFKTNDDEIIRFQLYLNRLVENKHLPRIVIWESIERYMAVRLSLIDFNPRLDIEKDKTQTPNTDNSNNEETVPETNLFEEISKNMEDGKEELKRSFLNTQEYVKRKLNVVDNPVKHMPLKQKLFTCAGSEDDLYFFYEDLNKVDMDVYNKAKQNLWTLISLTEQKGVKFLFVAPSDKYDLYKDFALNDEYKAIGQLDYFQEFNGNVRFLNCKELLYPHLKNGEKDVYKCHDTHWSPIAAKYVAAEIKRKLDSLK